MGQKINPKTLRLGITDVWRSRWFLRTKNFAKILEEDSKIRAFILKNYKRAGIDRVEIERFSDAVVIIVKTTKPGVLIGRAGGGIEDMKKKLAAELKLKTNFRINIEEVKNVNLSAQVWADNIAEQIEKRISHRRALKQTLDQIMDAGAEGAKVQVKGRLGGAEIARDEKLTRGRLPLHTLRANIEYGESTAFTTYGTIGIKVLINKGEVFESRKPEEKK